MNRFFTVLPAAAMALFALTVGAKLPPPSDEAKAKAAEAAAKSAHTDKVAAYQLCKSMDKVAAEYHAAEKKAGKPVKAAIATPPCTDPGPYVAPAQAASKPIEASGAHSPPQTATSPPSTPVPHADAPAKK